MLNAPPSPTYARWNSFWNIPSCSDGRTDGGQQRCQSRKKRHEERRVASVQPERGAETGMWAGGRARTMPSAPAIPSFGVAVPICLPANTRRPQRT